jgi:hypothetical protein
MTRWLLGCWFSHEPVREIRKGKLHWICYRCHGDLGVILKGQKFRERKPLTKGKILTLRSRRSG